MSILPPSNTSVKANATTHWQNLQAQRQRIADEQAARDADPVERAVRTIRSRGRVIFRASVHGGREDRWKHNGQLLDADAVIALAESIQRTLGLAGKSNPLPAPGQIRAVPPASPVPVSTAPIRMPAARRTAATAPISTPPASATGKQEAPMPNPHVHTAQSAKKPAGLPSEDHWASERGTTAASVRKDLADLKAVLGPAALADRLNTGKSSINNIILGHNTVGPTILAVLYGETGCTLKPTLAALLSSPAETQPQAISVEPAAEKPDAAAEATQPLETKADARNDDRQPGSLSQYIGAIKSVFEGVGAVFVHPGSTEAQSTAERHQMLPDLSHLNVGDLLANAERRRFALSAELAEVEDQIKAVLKLATASVQFKSDDDGFAAAFKSVAGAAA